MANKDEEYFGVLFSALEEKSQPCSVSEICRSIRGFLNKEKEITAMLLQMCSLDMVTKVNGDEYILKDKLESLQVGRSRSLEMDGDSQMKTNSSVSGLRSSPSSSQAPNYSLSQNTGAQNSANLPLSRAPRFPSSQNTGGAGSRYNADHVADALIQLNISHTNRDGQVVPPPTTMVQASSQSVSTFDYESSAIHSRNCQKIIDLLKQSSDPVLAKDIAQETEIGVAAGDVNRLLYFLEKQKILCKTDTKKPMWKLIREPSSADLERFGAELSKIPDSKRSKKKQNSSDRGPSTGSRSSRGESASASQGGIHLHKHEYNTYNTFNTTQNYYQIHVGDHSNSAGNTDENGASNQTESGERNSLPVRADYTGDNISSRQNMEEYKSRYLDDYVHCKRLGVGGFGVVFEAKNRFDDRICAIKRITLPDSENKRNKVLFEAKHLAKLNRHRGIVGYFHTWMESPPEGWQEEMDKQLGIEQEDDFDEEDSESMNSSSLNAHSSDDSFGIQFCKSSSDLKSNGQNLWQSTSSENSSTSSKRSKKSYLYIQMELCKPETLKEWLMLTKSREPCVVLDIFYQIVSAIKYVHENELMHRDLKPSNIFFSMEGVVKIGDFGFMKKFTDEHYEASGKSSKTKHTTNVGTELYMSPEIESGGIYSEKVDIYALGIILYELLYYFGTDLERHKTLTRVKKLDFPEEFTSKMPEETVLLKSLLSQTPEGRPSASEILSSDLLKEFKDA